MSLFKLADARPAFEATALAQAEWWTPTRRRQVLQAGIIVALLLCNAALLPRLSYLGTTWISLLAGAAFLLLVGRKVHASVLLLLIYGPFASALRFGGLSNVQALLKDLFAVGVFVLWLLRVLLRHEKIERSPLDIPLALFLLIAAVQVLHGPSFLRALLALKIHATYFTVFWLIWHNPPSSRFLRRATWVLLAVALVTGAYGLYQAVAGVPVEVAVAGIKAMVSTRLGAARIFSTFSHSIVYSMYLAMMIAWGLAFLRTLRGPARWAVLGILAVLTVNLPLTMSRTGWVALPLAWLVLLVCASTRRQRWAMLVLGMAGLGLFFAMASEVTRQTLALSFSAQDQSFQSRIVLLGNAFELMLRHPQGFGLGVLQDAGARVTRLTGDTGQMVMQFWQDLPIQDAESVALNVGVQMGLPGFIVYVWIWAAVWLAALRSYRQTTDPTLRSLGAGCLAFLAFMTFSDFLAGSVEAFPVVDLYFWYLVGVLLVLPRIEARERAQGANPLADPVTE